MKSNTNNIKRPRENRAKTASRILALIMAFLMVAGGAAYAVMLMLSAF